MKPDGSDQARLTHDGGNDGRPLWSPDGNQIIVDTDRGQPAEIYAMNPDGSGQTRLTHNVGQIGSIAWSLDGKQISFTSEGTGDDEIYVMNADGSNVTQLTYSPGQDTWSAWLPLPARPRLRLMNFLAGRPARRLARRWLGPCSGLTMGTRKRGTWLRDCSRRSLRSRSPCRRTAMRAMTST